MSLEGFLKKQGVKGPRKTFKKRWFVLKDDNKIYYYEKKNDAQEKGHIDLSEAISVTADQSKKSSFAFQINTPRRIYYLQAETQENADYWTNGVNDILKSLGTNSDVARLSALLEQANNRVGDLEAQLSKLRNALDFAAAELGTDRDTIVRRVDQGEKPKAPRAGDSGAASAATSSTPSATTSGSTGDSSASDDSSKGSSGPDGVSGEEKQVKTTFGAQVLYDYNARKDYELTIHVNEIITVLSQHENGWWLGCNHAGKQGYFPGSYVRALT